jgi:hypothetical protein
MQSKALNGSFENTVQNVPGISPGKKNVVGHQAASPVHVAKVVKEKEKHIRKVWLSGFFFFFFFKKF